MRFIDLGRFIFWNKLETRRLWLGCPSSFFYFKPFILGGRKPLSKQDSFATMANDLNANRVAENMADCLIGFGSNQGNSVSLYDSAIAELTSLESTELVAVSRLKTTIAVAPNQVQPDYLNGVIRLSSRLSLPKLFEQLVRIENQLGRTRAIRWGARAIDLDLLMYNSIQFESEQLQVPHPRMTFRRFVLEPAAEIAGDMFHPIARCTLGQLLIELNRKPQHLVWVKSLSSEIDNIVSLLADRLQSAAINRGQPPEAAEASWQIGNWQISVIGRIEDFEKNREFAKIVVWEDPRPQEMQGVQFTGAQLDLKNSTLCGSLDTKENRIADEIAGAILSCQTDSWAGDDTEG